MSNHHYQRHSAMPCNLQDPNVVAWLLNQVESRASGLQAQARSDASLVELVLDKVMLLLFAEFEKPKTNDEVDDDDDDDDDDETTNLTEVKKLKHVASKLAFPIDDQTLRAVKVGSNKTKNIDELVDWLKFVL